MNSNPPQKEAIIFQALVMTAGKDESMNWRKYLPMLIVTLIPYTLIRLINYTTRPYLWWHILIDLVALAIIVAFTMYMHKRIEGHNIIFMSRVDIKE